MGSGSKSAPELGGALLDGRQKIRRQKRGDFVDDVGGHVSAEADEGRDAAVAGIGRMFGQEIAQGALPLELAGLAAAAEQQIAHGSEIWLLAGELAQRRLEARLIPLELPLVAEEEQAQQNLGRIHSLTHDFLSLFSRHSGVCKISQKRGHVNRDGLVDSLRMSSVFSPPVALRAG